MSTRSSFKVGDVFETNRDGKVKITKLNGRVATVVFEDTGFEREVLTANLRKGKCKDLSVTKRDLSEITYPNTVMSSNSSGNFTILQKQGKRCFIQFELTGYTTEVEYSNAVDGKVKDPYSKSCYGVGCNGEFERLPYWKQAKQLWRNMLKRCYCEKDERGYFGKVTVDDRWLCFANFLSDLKDLENFDLWLNAQFGNYTKYNLDKDFKVSGNKVYSKDACMFLPESFNKSLTSRTNKWVSANDTDLT